jgi:hypothetical protein
MCVKVVSFASVSIIFYEISGVVFPFYHFTSHICVITSHLPNKWSIFRIYMSNSIHIVLLLMKRCAVEFAYLHDNKTGIILILCSVFSIDQFNN